MIAKNGRVAAGTCRDHKIRVWALPDARLLQTFDVSGREIALTALSDAGQQILVASYTGDVTVWDSNSGNVRFQEHLEHYPLAAAFSHDGRFLATGSAQVDVFDLSANRVVFNLADAPAGTVALAFSRDNARLATAEGNGVVRVHDARTGALVSENHDFLMEPLAIDFTSDGKQVVAAGADKSIVFIDAATGKTLRRTKKLANAIFYLEVSPDGREIAVVTLDANNLQLPSPVLVLDLASFEERARWNPPKGMIGGSWTTDGHLIGATATPEAVHLSALR